MEGDLANLSVTVELRRKYSCSIIVDETHGLRAFGRRGRGVCGHFGLTHEVDLIMGTFLKGLASIDGSVASDSDTTNYLRYTCRAYIFSASDAPAATTAIRGTLCVIQAESGWIEHL